MITNINPEFLLSEKDFKELCKKHSNILPYKIFNILLDVGVKVDFENEE